MQEDAAYEGEIAGGSSSVWDPSTIEGVNTVERGPGPTSISPAYFAQNPVPFGSNATRSNYDRYPANYGRIGGYPDNLPIVHNQHGPNVVWRMVTLPFSIVRGSFNFIFGAVGLGMWVAGGVINYSLGALGLNPADRRGDQALLSVPSGTVEAADFLRNFEQEYGDYHPTFQLTSFMEALRTAGQQFKFLFVYLHSPEHANTPPFCERTLCSEPVTQFVNENFVAWGGDVRTSEGFQMSNSLKASTFPFCAVVMGSTNQRIALLQQVCLFDQLHPSKVICKVGRFIGVP